MWGEGGVEAGQLRSVAPARLGLGPLGLWVVVSVEIRYGMEMKQLTNNISDCVNWD